MFRREENIGSFCVFDYVKLGYAVRDWSPSTFDRVADATAFLPTVKQRASDIRDFGPHDVQTVVGNNNMHLGSATTMASCPPSAPPRSCRVDAS